MTAILVATIAAAGSIFAAYLASRASARSAALQRDHEELNLQYEEAKKQRDACERDRRQLRQLIQLIAGAFVGLLPERDSHQEIYEMLERLTLLRSIDEAMEDVA